MGKCRSTSVRKSMVLNAECTYAHREGSEFLLLMSIFSVRPTGKCTHFKTAINVIQDLKLVRHYRVL
jgi:hypothetical protein